jgi:(2Fe-2S) ferredoxin
MGQYKHHVFICTTGKTCSWQGGPEVHETMKKAVHRAGLKGVVRVNHAGCMNQCGHGPMVVVYPQDVWYARVDEKAAERIVEQHIVGGRVAEKYLHRAPPGDNKLESRR